MSEVTIESWSVFWFELNWNKSIPLSGLTTFSGVADRLSIAPNWKQSGTLDELILILRLTQRFCYAVPGTAAYVPVGCEPKLFPLSW